MGTIIADLQRIDTEIVAKAHLKNIKRILAFFLLDFLINKNLDQQISDLKVKKAAIVNSIEKQLKEIENARNQIREITNSASEISELDLNQWFDRLIALKESYFTFNKIEILAKTNQNYLNLLSDSALGLLNLRKELICNEISRIICNGEYLTFSEKELFNLKLKLQNDNMDHFKQSGLIGNDYYFKAKLESVTYQKFVDSYNPKFIERRKEEYAHLFKNAKFSLDEDQKAAIIKDDKHNLVVAAAGSGKTEVLINRIAYLLEKKPNSIKPDRILAIAFQAKAKDEIKTRLKELSNSDFLNVDKVNVRTFHKLGKDIYESHLGRKILHKHIANDNESNRTIKEIYENKLNTDTNFYHLFLNYMKFYNTPSTKNKDAALREKEFDVYVAIDNTRVNSIAEKVIMDFLLTHKINGEKIEVQYEPILDQFKPDFYINKFDLYIEHWGLNKDERPPKWFNQSGEKYREIKAKKKKWFLENKKSLVETFTYEYNENQSQQFLTILQDRIIQKLQEKQQIDVVFTPLSYEEIVEIAWAPYKDPNSRNVTEFIKNAKTYNLTPERIVEKLKNGKWDLKQTTFGLMALEVYRDYEKWLKNTNKIDFGDMINKAIEALLQDSHLYYDVLDHILIDEYQDISEQRQRLIKTLLERNPKCKLFCVGDDWQSIMGFSGSNLNYFVNFNKYFTNPEVTPISTNYRSQKTIVDAGAALIKNNGQNQIPKSTMSKKIVSKKIKVICSNHLKKYWKHYYEQTSDDCAEKILKCIQGGVSPNDILVLSRYRFPRIVDCFAEKAKELGISVSNGRKPPQKNQIRLMNVHRCKGLQAKVVFILNVIKDPYGFPCEIEDSSILEPARENYPRQDQNQEERRLFYVAITRAMEELTIYTWEPARSQFLREIAPFTSEETLNYWDQKRKDIKQVVQHQSSLISNGAEGS